MSHKDITIKIELKGDTYVDQSEMSEFATELIKILTDTANKKIRKKNLWKTASNKIHLNNLSVSTFPNT